MSIIDNINGSGSVPWNQEIGYRGLSVLMDADTFMDLALELKNPRTDRIDYLKDTLTYSGKIGSPFLTIRIPDEWSDGDYTTPAEVVGHEGRHRMCAVKELYGDTPIEVHLFLENRRARDLNADMIESIGKRLYKQFGQNDDPDNLTLIQGQLFQVPDMKPTNTL